MSRRNLARMLAPTTVAVVGASENLGMSNNAVLPMLEAGRDVLLVNPNRSEVYGRAAAPSLSALGVPVDAVLSLVSAERSVDVVREAARLGCGGVAVAAGGFSELGSTGAVLQARLVEAAAEGEEPIALVGPNCSGFMNVRNGTNLFTGGRIGLSPGPVAVLSQSGFLVRSTLAAGQQRQLGFGVAVSTGNEAVCGLAEYLEVLADDPETRVVCLVIEKIRDSQRFLDALANAQRRGQIVMATKLGRTDASREIMRSHTGAIADESWVYELVLRQAGVITAIDIDEMMDNAQLLAQVAPARRRPIDGVAVITSSGGVAGVAADAAVDAGIPLADMSQHEQWIRERVPGDGVLNPLDMTGFVMRDRALMQSLFERYANAGTVDALVLCWWAGEGDEGWSRLLLEPYAEMAEKAAIPIIVTPVEATAVGGWTRSFAPQGVSFCRGLTSTYRALRALDDAARAKPTAPGPHSVPPEHGAPPALVHGQGGSFVPFATAMAMLEDCGLPVAPWALIPAELDEDALARVADRSEIAALGEALVVKLADVAHRTELGAVRVNVRREELACVIAELRAIAAANAVPTSIAVQRFVPGYGEAFIGLHGMTDFGPLLLLGRGGVLVEVAGRVDGRLLPLAAGQAGELVEAVGGERAMHGLRGQRPWPTEHVSRALEAVDRLWHRHGAWIASADVNPLVLTADGAFAVDALIVARTTSSNT